MNNNWITVIIVLLIIGIVLDGLRRMRLAKRKSLRLSKNANKADLKQTSAASASEFPSGGARVAGYRDEQDASSLNRIVKEKYESKRVTLGAPQRIPEQVSLNLEESVPMLMDSVEPEASTETWDEEFTEPNEPELGAFENLQGEVETQEVSEPYSTEVVVDQEPGGDEEETGYQEPDEVLIMNVMAKTGQRFAGKDLLAVLMEAGLKFGDMDIFHRHLENDGDAPILFSLANMVVPGTFSLADMEEFETPGVSLFLSLPIAGESLAAYNDMANIAQRLAERLGGELKDENRSVMTSQTIEHGRQRVIEYERKKKLSGVD